jgi:PAS domain-containing protein
MLPKQNAGAVFLFDGDTLVDCNASGRHILSQSGIKTNDWHKLVAFLSPYFHDLESQITKLPQLGALAQTGAADNGKVILLEAEINAGLTRISVTDPDIAEGPGLALALAHRALQRDVQDLRKALSAAPGLIWRETEKGEIVWANDAYLLLCSRVLPKGQTLSWPLPRLFDRSATVQSAEGQRQSVVTLGQNNVTKTLWFDLLTHAYGADLLCFASPADTAVAAENSLRDFMQTLSKTFAQLPIGLAIFDKDRKLQMFNPALLELTTLPPDFLMLKPTLVAVLDAMREIGRAHV